LANRYSKLMGNTLIFAIGSFSSKLIVFLMMRYYTEILSPPQYSVADRITSTANLLMPFVMLSVNEAVIRFGMERTLQKSDVFTIGLKTVLTGFVVFLACSPLMLFFRLLSPYIALIAVYVLFGMLKSVTAQFVRATGMVRLFVLDGFVSTATTIGFNILFLSAFHWGVEGYVLATVASNILSVCLLFFFAHLRQYVDFGSKNPGLRREMLRYCVPLIPTTMFWWITNVSDRYVVTWFWGEGANGLYAAAAKLPNLLTIVSAIFYQAWQLSAVSEKDSDDALAFYSEVYDYYMTLLFLAASGLLMLLRPITGLYLARAYYDGWRHSTFLVLGEVFSSLVTFLGTFYMVEKRNATVPLAIALGAGSNLVLNLLLVPRFGPLAAAFTTFVSYLLSFVVRAADVHRVVPIRMRVPRCAGNLALLLVQLGMMFFPQTAGFLFQLGMFAIVALFNLRPALRMLTGLLTRFGLAPGKGTRMT